MDRKAHERADKQPEGEKVGWKDGRTADRDVKYNETSDVQLECVGVELRLYMFSQKYSYDNTMKN